MAAVVIAGFIFLLGSISGVRATAVTAPVVETLTLEFKDGQNETVDLEWWPYLSLTYLRRENDETNRFEYAAFPDRLARRIDPNDFRPLYSQLVRIFRDPEERSTWMIDLSVSASESNQKCTPDLAMVRGLVLFLAFSVAFLILVAIVEMMDGGWKLANWTFTRFAVLFFLPIAVVTLAVSHSMLNRICE